MRPAIQIVVTCTKRKTLPAAPRLMLRSLASGTLAARAAEWLARLRCGGGERVCAEMLYAGDHWSVVRSMVDAATSSGHQARIWICSAGYGLISLASKVSAYSATFSPSHPDSVCRKLRGSGAGEAPKNWWRALSGWEGPTPGQPRRLMELAAESHAAIWIIASEIYLCAISDDVGDLIRALRKPDRLAIFSAGTQTSPGLTEHLVPCDARLQSLVGGARRSLNTRVALKALREIRHGDPTLPALRTKFARLLKQQPAIQRFERLPMDDERVRKYIQKALATSPKQRPTPLLRQLREHGYACEHRRFTSIYHQVEERLNDR